MPVYAILGATGQTGSEVVNYLLPTENKLHIYARSSTRLTSKHPSLSSSSSSKVNIFIGDLSDEKLLAECLEGVDVIFSTVAQNQNEPGCTIARRTAGAIVKALESNNNKSGSVSVSVSVSKGKKRYPAVIFLSSAGIDPRRPGGYFDILLHFTLRHVYGDLEEAIIYLQSIDWLPIIVASPGALIHVEEEHQVTLTEDMVDDNVMSYKDLAKGMVMMAEDDEKWVGKRVGMVVNSGKPIGGNPAALLRYLLPNLLVSVCPPLWRLGRDWVAGVSVTLVR